MPRHRTDPEHVWVIDHYRVRRWYYREAPQTGDHVYYMDGTRTRITNVSSTRVHLANSCTMRRPYALARLATWAQPRLRHGLIQLKPMKVRTSKLRGEIIYM